MALYGKIRAKLGGKPFCTMVVLAAGSSKRMGRDKLMMEVGGIPVLVRSLQAMQNCAAVDELIVVTRTSRLEEIAALRDRYALTKMTKVVVGGMTRAESSLAGVLAASNRATLIGVHDAARPLVTDVIITDTISAAQKSRAAAPGIPVRDTVKVTSDGIITGTPARSTLSAIQTPQVFQADVLKAALQSAQAAVDAAQLNLDYTQVKAPISGLTSMEVQSEGSLISTSGEGGLLTHITQLNPIYVMFSMSETEMMKMAEMIEKGYLAQPQRKDQIKAKLNAGDGWQYPQAGDIDFVNPTVDQETGTIKLRAVFDNPKGRIRPGQFLRLSVEGVVRADALVVPQTAVMQGANGSYVYRINAQDKIEAAPITTGFATKDGGWIVDTGLNPGDRVVVSGLLKLRPGMAAAPQIMNATSAAENNPAVKGYARAAGETGTVSDGAGAVNAAESTGAGAAGETGTGAGATTDGAAASGAAVKE